MKLMDKLLFDDRNKSIRKHNQDKKQRALTKLDQEISKIFEIENKCKEGIIQVNMPQINSIAIDFEKTVS